MFNINNNFNPGDDFDNYVNHNWKRANPIPDDETRWGTYNVLTELTNNRLKEIIEDTSLTDNNDYLKIQNLYQSGMDQEKLNKEGFQPINSYMAKIDSITNIDQVSEYICLMLNLQLSTPFYISVHSDAKDSDKNILHLYQGGLGLPDRDYYFLPNKESDRFNYKEFLSKIFNSYQENDDTENEIKQIYKLEETLANISLTKTERREPELVYNEYSTEKLIKDFPNIKWKQIFKALNITPGKIIVDNPKFFETLNELINTENLTTIKNYLKSNLLRSSCPYLGDDQYDIYFDFYGRHLQGQQEMKPRWKRVIGNVENLLGEILGKIYVEKYFPESAKARALKMVNNLKLELAKRIKLLDWMSDETKIKALEKLDNFGVKIGYPDKWKDYSNLKINNNNYFENVINAQKFDMDYDLSQLNKEVDKDQWHMHPQQINAYYNPLLNEIVFPAGILQPPFFDYQAYDAVNYGGIGAVIGHEMTHGFDDKGRKYDKNGNLNDWWNKEDVKRYEEKAEKIKQQFNNYLVEGEKVNGELTLGENIADLGGITIAYYALQSTLEGKCVELIDGFDQYQRFFMSWANVWKNNIRKEEALNRLVTDPHSPTHLRVNGVVTNMIEFYQAFNVKPENKLYKTTEERASVW